MIRQIFKPTAEEYDKAFYTMDFSQVDRIEEKALEQVREVIAAIQKGIKQVAFFDLATTEQGGDTSFLRYALHKSSRQAGILQFTCLEIRNGQEIPTGHKDIEDQDGAAEILDRMPTRTIINCI